jgi:hypothetical protein
MDYLDDLLCSKHNITKFGFDDLMEFFDSLAEGNAKKKGCPLMADCELYQGRYDAGGIISVDKARCEDVCRAELEKGGVCLEYDALGVGREISDKVSQITDTFEGIFKKFEENHKKIVALRPIRAQSCKKFNEVYQKIIGGKPAKPDYGKANTPVDKTNYPLDK